MLAELMVQIAGEAGVKRFRFVRRALWVLAAIAVSWVVWARL